MNDLLTATPNQERPNDEAAQIDRAELIEQIWTDLKGTVDRFAVARTVDSLLAKYDAAVIWRYVPLLVRREAGELLQIITVANSDNAFEYKEKHGSRE